MEIISIIVTSTLFVSFAALQFWNNKNLNNQIEQLSEKLSKEIEETHKENILLGEKIAKRPIHLKVPLLNQEQKQLPEPSEEGEMPEPEYLPFNNGTTISYMIDDEALANITYIEKIQDEGISVPVNEKLKKEVSGAIQLFAGKVVPEVGREIMDHGNFKLVLSPEISKKIHEGAYELVKSKGGFLSNVRDNETGKFAHHGKFVKAGSLGQSICRVGFQVASVVTTQYYLHEINQKFEVVENGIQDIKSILLEEEKAEIDGNFRYLADIYSMIQQSDFSEQEIQAFITKLEDIEQKCHEITCRLKDRIQKDFNKLVEIKNQKLKKDQALSEVETLKDNFRRNFKQHIMTNCTRILICQLGAALATSREMIKVRLLNVQNEIQFIFEAKNKLSEHILQSAELNHYINKEKAKSEYNDEMKQINSRLIDEVTPWLHQAKDFKSNFEKKMSDQQEAENRPMCLNVRFLNGELVEAKHIKAKGDELVIQDY